MGEPKRDEDPFPFLSPKVAEALKAYQLARQIVDNASEASPFDMILAQKGALAYADVVIARMRLDVERNGRNEFRQSLCEHGWRPVAGPNSPPALVMWHCKKCGQYTRRAREQTTPCGYAQHDWVRIDFEGEIPTADGYSLLCNKCGSYTRGGP